MTKDARRRAQAGRDEARSACGRSGAAGAWMVPVALGVCLAVWLGAAILGGAVQLPAMPVHEPDPGLLSGGRGDYRLDINRATATELGYLEGIGETLAERIIAWREANGPFESVEQLVEVEGIGEGKLSAIRDLITAGEQAPAETDLPD